MKRPAIDVCTHVAISDGVGRTMQQGYRSAIGCRISEPFLRLRIISAKPLCCDRNRALLKSVWTAASAAAACDTNSRKAARWTAKHLTRFQVALHR